MGQNRSGKIVITVSHPTRLPGVERKREVTLPPLEYSRQLEDLASLIQSCYPEHQVEIEVNGKRRSPKQTEL